MKVSFMIGLTLLLMSPSILGIIATGAGIITYLSLAWIFVINLYILPVGLIIFALWKELRQKMEEKNGW